MEYHGREILTIQGLGLQGKALRYQVQSIRLGYLNDGGKFTTFSVPLPGIRTDVLVTDEVMDKMLYLNVDRNLPLPVVFEMLREQRPDLTITHNDCYYSIGGRGNIEVDLAEVGERLGRDLEMSSFLVVMSSYYGRVKIEEKRFGIYAELLDIDK